MDAELLLQHQRFLRRIVRGLARDEQAAEDLEQATWLAALERPPRSSESLRTWLARVARNLSFNRRRAEASEALRRERLRGERSWPAADDVAAELELAERVLAAVKELPEPLRAAVHARYYEERALEEIARHSGVSVDTIKERIERARAILRRKLGRELGEERGLIGALVLWIRRAGWSLARGLLMKKLIALVVLVLLFVFGVRAFQRSGVSATGDARAESADLAAAEVQAATEAAVIEPSAARTPAELAPATVAVEPGSLLLAVTWPDGSAAADVSARVWPDEEGELVRSYRKATTLADGHCEVDGLAPGTWRVQLDRETSFERVEIRAGAETIVDLAVSGGSRLEGVVVDEHGRPVAGAGVWISPRQPSYRSGEPLDDWFAATTGADGRFAIPALGKAWIIGARAEGYAPSLQKPVRWKRAVEELRFVLPGLGGAIEGRVLGSDGAPIAGAVVSGDMGLRYWETERPNGTKYRLILNDLPLRTISARDGSFRFGGVQPGSVELSVATPTQRGWSQELQVSASATTRVDVTLEDGQTLTGRVRTSDGAPLAGLVVFASASAFDEAIDENAPWLQQDWATLLEHSRDSFVTTRSRADGSYRLTGLQAGWNFVAAENGDAGRALHSLRIEPSSDPSVEAHQDLVLARGLELRCQLVDASGAPLAGLSVFVQREVDGGTAGSRGPFKTDAEGRIAVADCQDAPYSLDIRHARFDTKLASADAHDLGPGPTEHRIVVAYEDPPAASVSGIVLDDTGRPVSGARVDLGFVSGGSNRIGTTDAQGAFRSADFAPGTYSFSIRAPDFPYVEFAARAVPAGATLDLGVVQLKTPGFLNVTLRRADGAPIDDERWRVDLYTPDKSYVWTSFEVELGVARSDPIEPGDYVLKVTGVEERPVHVAAGVTQELEVVAHGAR